MKRLIIFGVLAALVSAAMASPTQAQGRLFPADTSGFSIAVGASSGDDFTSQGVAMALTSRTQFDMGIAVSRLSLDNNVIGNGGSGVEIRPFASWAVLRPARGKHLGLELAAGYSKGVYESDDMIFEGWFQARDALSVGTNIYVRLVSSPTLVIYPGFSVDYVKYDLDSGRTGSADDDLAYGLDVTFRFNDKVYLTPAYQSIGDDKVFSLSLGLLISGT